MPVKAGLQMTKLLKVETGTGRYFFFVAIYEFVWSVDQISDELVSETADATDDLQPQWSQGPDSVRYTEGAEDNGRCVRPSSCLTPS